jgi:raffinose/stachyose/melibiose transport system permease protein
MLAPTFAILLVFILIPLVNGINLSLSSWNGVSPTMEWVGFDNWIAVWTDTRFLEAMGRTLYWAVMHLVLAVGGALLLAALMYELRWARLRTVFRSLAFLPNVLALSVVGVIWGQVYHPSIGLLNATLDAVGLGDLGRAWLGEQTLALTAVGVASAWQAFGFYLVIFLAGMQSIDPALGEAAALDGAGILGRFRHVTLPSLYNTMSLVIALAFANALKGFGTVWAMTGGGPVDSTELAAVYVWRQAFEEGAVGVATAAGLSIAVVAMLIVFVVTTLRDRRAGTLT